MENITDEIMASDDELLQAIQYRQGIADVYRDCTDGSYKAAWYNLRIGDFKNEAIKRGLIKQGEV
jgi:hypothetical protein